MSVWGCRWERKVADCWIGVFWKREARRLDIWICLVPCFPLHITRLSGPVGRHDPTHGRIDFDIQDAVDKMNPINVAQRVALENTFQAKRCTGAADCNSGVHIHGCFAERPIPVGCWCRKTGGVFHAFDPADACPPVAVSFGVRARGRRER